MLQLPWSLFRKGLFYLDFLEIDRDGDTSSRATEFSI